MSSVLSAPLTSDPALDQQAGGGLPLSPGTMLAPNQQLSRNPMLPQHPLGAYTDSQYEADDAMLRRQVAQQYADLLQQLGYVDENGQFIQGSVEAEANKQASGFGRQQDLAREQVTREAQNNGTLFSGIRGTLQGRAEDPFVRARADLMAATPLSLQQLYEHAAGLSGDYVLNQNQLLASAAARRAAGIITDPGIGVGGLPTGGASVTPPVTDPAGGASLAPTFGVGGAGYIEPGVVGLEGQRMPPPIPPPLTPADILRPKPVGATVAAA